MSWIRFGVVFVVLLVVLLVATQFALVNSDPVTVRYFAGTATVPLSLVVVFAFATGLVLASVAGWLGITRWRWKAGRLSRALDQNQKELAELRESLRKAKSSP